TEGTAISPPGGHRPGHGPATVRTRSTTRRSAPPLLPDPHGDLDGRALEPERLAQPALDEPPVPGLEEPGGEDDEPRRAGRGLRREQDARLLAATQRVRVGRDELAEEAVELAGRHTP